MMYTSAGSAESGAEPIPLQRSPADRQGALLFTLQAEGPGELASLFYDTVEKPRKGSVITVL